jgi:amidase
METTKLSFINDEWIIEATIDDLQQVMASGKTTSKKIVETYLNRIAAFDKSGMKINSILEINPDVLFIAESLDLERKEKGIRGPLHGIPVVLKDNIDTGDKMHTSAGTLSLKNSFAPKDAFVAKKLRDAGAVILGKANLTEFANFMTENMPNGYSSRGGQVLNPYGPGIFDVGGSSAGSGASVAANLTAVAIGTETSGSILSPSSQNSIVGIKPTLGLVSRSGIIPIAHSQDTAGPMARTVKDAAILLSAIIGVDMNDASTLIIPQDFNSDFISSLDVDGLKGVRVGVPRKGYFNDLGEDKLAIINNALELMKEKGAEVIDPVELPFYDMELNYDVLIYEFKSDLNAYLKNLASSVPVHSLKEVIEFNNNHPEETLKYGQIILKQSENTSGTLTEPGYLENLLKDKYYTREQGIDSIMKKYNLDALLFPSYFGADIAAKAGYPSITVPGGYTNAGEPIGVTFTGTAFSEPKLIKIAYAYEQSTKHRVVPVL